MKNLELLNKKQLLVIFFYFIFGLTAQSQEPIDIWNIEEKKTVKNTDIIENNDFEFHFIGPIPMDKQIKNDKIVYHGVVQDKTKLTGLLDAGDVLVCPSHSEGMPNVILEGMARGMAVIATDVGAVRLLVSEKVGVLLKEIDKEELKQAILTLSKLEPPKLLEMKINSLELVSNEFQWERIVEKFIEKVKEVING